MSNKMTASELAIVSALAAEAVEVLQRDVSLAVEIVEDRIQFLLDAELIEVDDVSELVRKVLHLALDAALDEIEDCDEEEECEDCDCSDEDEEEDEDERAY
jgi:predicted nucleic-acid-binding protein